MNTLVGEFCDSMLGFNKNPRWQVSVVVNKNGEPILLLQWVSNLTLIFRLLTYVGA